MTKKLETNSVDARLEDLLLIFARDLVAIVMEGDQFLGPITRIDPLNDLRRKMK